MYEVLTVLVCWQTFVPQPRSPLTHTHLLLILSFANISSRPLPLKTVDISSSHYGTYFTYERTHFDRESSLLTVLYPSYDGSDVVVMDGRSF